MYGCLLFAHYFLYYLVIVIEQMKAFFSSQVLVLILYFYFNVSVQKRSNHEFISYSLPEINPSGLFRLILTLVFTRSSLRRVATQLLRNPHYTRNMRRDSLCSRPITRRLGEGRVFYKITSFNVVPV